MPSKTPETSPIVSVRLSDDLLQRLDRLLDWQTTHRRRPATRNAAMREALRGWLDQQEQLAGLLNPHVLLQQFQTAYNSLRPPPDGGPHPSATPTAAVASGAFRCHPRGPGCRAARRPRDPHGACLRRPSDPRQLPCPWPMLCPAQVACVSGGCPFRMGAPAARVGGASRVPPPSLQWPPLYLIVITTACAAMPEAPCPRRPYGSGCHATSMPRDTRPRVTSREA